MPVQGEVRRQSQIFPGQALALAYQVLPGLEKILLVTARKGEERSGSKVQPEITSRHYCSITGDAG